MSSGRQAKLRKLDQFRRDVPYVSQNALDKICQWIKQNGLPELTSRVDMWRAAELGLESCNDYGELLQEIKLVGKDGGKGVESLAVNFASYVSAAFSQGGAYTNLVIDTHKKSASSPEKPWQMIVYSDEIDAGDPVAPRGHTRKLWAIYFSFVEFGPVNLSHEEAWLTLRLERTVDVDLVAAGRLSNSFSMQSYPKVNLHRQ